MTWTIPPKLSQTTCHVPTRHAFIHGMDLLGEGPVVAHEVGHHAVKGLVVLLHLGAPVLRPLLPAPRPPPLHRRRHHEAVHCFFGGGLDRVELVRRRYTLSRSVSQSVSQSASRSVSQSVSQPARQSRTLAAGTLLALAFPGPRRAAAVVVLLFLLLIVLILLLARRLACRRRRLGLLALPPLLRLPLLLLPAFEGLGWCGVGCWREWWVDGRQQANCYAMQLRKGGGRNGATRAGRRGGAADEVVGRRRDHTGRGTTGR